jgi:predicted HTH domain antitoxin
MESKVLHIHFPCEILLDTGLTEQRATEKMLQLFVLDLYKHHHISSGKGAEILGIRKYDFVQLLAEAGVDYFDYSPEELENEFEQIEQWKKREADNEDSPLEEHHE